MNQSGIHVSAIVLHQALSIGIGTMGALTAGAPPPESYLMLTYYILAYRASLRALPPL